MIDIEKAILGLIIRRGGDESLTQLKTAYFNNPHNQRLFDTIKQLFIENQPIDIVTVAQQYGNATYVTEVSDMADTMIGTKQELDGLIDKLKQRYARDILSNALKNSYNALKSKSVLEVRAELLPILEQINTDVNNKRPKKLKTALYDTLGWIEKQFILHEEGRIFTTHLPDLNDYIGGLTAPDIILVGARPSVGKTAFGMDIALHAALKGKKTYFISLEMNSEALCTRYLAGKAEIDTHKIRSGKINDADWSKLANAVGPLSKLDINIDDFSRTVSEMKIWAREIKAQDGLDLIVVDYLQLIHPEGKQETREREISSISQSLKELAKDVDVPVIVLTQLSRKAANKRPTLSDFRESGALEQDADIAFLMWEPPEDELKTEWQIIKDTLNKQGNRLIELIIAKQRNGPTGAIYLCFIPGKSKFVCLPKGGDMNA